MRDPGKEEIRRHLCEVPGVGPKPSQDGDVPAADRSTAAPFVLLPPFPEVAAHQQQDAEPGMSIGMMGRERDRAAELRDVSPSLPDLQRQAAQRDTGSGGRTGNSP
jgi:hypothetical protein